MSARFPHLVDPVFLGSAPASRLGLLRILTGLWTLLYVGRRRRMLARVARTDPSLFSPVGVARVLREPLAPASARALTTATQVANLAFILGWRHAYTGPLFAGALLSLLSYRNSWSMVYHNDNLLVLHVLALGVAPAADCLSLDSRARERAARRSLARRAGASALLRRATGTVADPRLNDGDSRYGWPIALMNSATAATYFLAGVAKLKGPLGRRWATGESLLSQVAVDRLRKRLLGGADDGAPSLALRLRERIALFRLLAVGSLVIELGAPLALVDRRLARLWALGAFGMHWGIYSVMGIKFRYQLAGLVFAPFFDVERGLTGVPPARRVMGDLCRR